MIQTWIIECIPIIPGNTREVGTGNNTFSQAMQWSQGRSRETSKDATTITKGERIVA
jgi:hypothetical protein